MAVSASALGSLFFLQMAPGTFRRSAHPVRIAPDVSLTIDACVGLHDADLPAVQALMALLRNILGGQHMNCGDRWVHPVMVEPVIRQESVEGIAYVVL